MHLVIDMQGAQVGNRYRGIGCADLALAKAIARNRGEVHVTLALSGLMPGSVQPIIDEFAAWPGAADVRIWQAVGPTRAAAPGNDRRRDVSERLREAFLASLRPDVVLVTRWFDGFDDDAVISVGLLEPGFPTAALLYDSLPPSDPNADPAVAAAVQAWRRHRLESLRRCRMLPAASESVRLQVMDALPESHDLGIDVTRTDSLDETARQVLRALRAVCSPGARRASALVNVETTGIFRRRALRILVIKLDHLGDFVLAIPAITKLRARYPDAHIEAVVGSWNLDLARELKIFANVHPYDFFKRKSAEAPSADPGELAALLARLGAYDMAIDLRRQAESRFLLAQVVAGLKVGYQSFDAAVDARMDIMLRSYKDLPHKSTPLNETPIARQLLRLIDALPPDPNDYVSLPRLAPDAERIRGRVAIFPKAGVAAREWGRDRFTELARRLLDARQVESVQVLFVNQREAAEFDLPVGARLQLHVGLEFQALARLLSTCSLCIANNSGGLHLASYLGVPVLGIYSGHELASEWGPQLHGGVAMHRQAACSPCHIGRKADCPHDNFCLGDIAVDDVFEKAAEALDGHGQSGAAGDSGVGEGRGISPQQSGDTLVRRLLKSVASHLQDADVETVVAVACAIANNHPTYSLSPDLGNVVPNEFVAHNSTLIEWVGFSPTEAKFRWTDGDTAVMRFFLEGIDTPPAVARLLVEFDTFGTQRILARLNGLPVFNAMRRGRRLRLDIAVANLRLGYNRLEFHLPDAASPGRADPRKLGLAVRRFKVIV